VAGEAALGRTALGIGARLGARAPLAALGPLGWAAIAALTLYDGYQLYNMMSESAETSDAKPEDCTGDCQEKKKKREDDKIEEMDNDSTQKPGDKDFNKDRPGDVNDANKDFDDLVGKDYKDQGGGIRTGTLSDGRKVTVRPTSKSNGPTLDVQQPNGRPFRKYRYPGPPSS
jgi:hypothetical protein